MPRRVCISHQRNGGEGKHPAHRSRREGEGAGVGYGSGVLVLQVAYEAFAACTGIVVDASGERAHPLHLRTMDWDMPALAALTCEVDFVRGGALLFRATTWVGYVGVLTGLKPGAFSVAVNYRRTEAAAATGQDGKVPAPMLALPSG